MNNVQSGSSSKKNKDLNVNKSVSGFKRTIPRIPAMTSRIFHVSFVERKTIIFKNVCSSKNKKDDDENANEAIVIDDIIAIVSDVCNNMITVTHMAIITNPSDWWFDSGAMLHVYNYKTYFKTYKESSIELEVLVGIHSKTKVHHC